MRGARIGVIAIVLGACAYTTPTTNIEADDPTTPDASPGDGDVVGIVPCATADPTGLVLCLELEDGVGDGTLYDSSPGRRHATSTGLAPVMRTVPADSPAAQIGTDAVARVADDPALDLAAGYTFAVWVHPDVLPAQGVAYGVLDREQQYAMLIARSAGGTVQNRCVHTGVARFEWTENLPEGEWSFLACTWNGTQLCAYRWSSPTSSEHFCHAVDLLPNAPGREGLAIGHLSDTGAAHSRFGGALDSVQLYNRAMSDEQLCAHIGRAAGCM